MSDIIESLSVRLRGQISTLKSAIKRSTDGSCPPGGAGSPASISWETELLSNIESGSREWIQVYMSQLRSAGVARLSPDDTISLLIVSTLLCFQKIFKHLLLSGNPISILFFKFIKSPKMDFQNIDIKLWYKECMFAFLKCRADKPRIVSDQLAAAGFTFEDQEKFEESIASNRQISTALGTSGGSDEWDIEPEESFKLMSGLGIDDEIVGRLVITKSSSSLACLARIPQYRKYIVKHHGIDVLLDPGVTGDKEQKSVAIARICMTTDPHAWNYHQSISLAESCYSLIRESAYELYQYEACIGLTNLLSHSDDVREHIARKTDSTTLIFDTFSSTQNEKLQTAIIEVFCNLCVSETTVEVIVDKQLMEPIRILGFIIGVTDGVVKKKTTSPENPPEVSPEDACESLRSAASGALAILTGYAESYELVEKAIGADGILQLLTKYINGDDIQSPDILLRVISILSNVVEFTLLDNLKTRIQTDIHKHRNSLIALRDDRITSIVDSAF